MSACILTRACAVYIADASAAFAAKRVASIEDDEMREFDPDEHLEMLGHGIPEQYGNHPCQHNAYFIIFFAFHLNPFEYQTACVHDFFFNLIFQNYLFS